MDIPCSLDDTADAQPHERTECVLCFEELSLFEQAYPPCSCGIQICTQCTYDLCVHAMKEETLQPLCPNTFCKSVLDPRRMEVDPSDIDSWLRSLPSHSRAITQFDGWDLIDITEFITRVRRDELSDTQSLLKGMTYEVTAVKERVEDDDLPPELSLTSKAAEVESPALPRRISRSATLGMRSFLPPVDTLVHAQSERAYTGGMRTFDFNEIRPSKSLPSSMSDRTGMCAYCRSRWRLAHRFNRALSEPPKKVESILMAAEEGDLPDTVPPVGTMTYFYNSSVDDSDIEDSQRSETDGRRESTSTTKKKKKRIRLKLGMSMSAKPYESWGRSRTLTSGRLKRKDRSTSKPSSGDDTGRRRSSIPDQDDPMDMSVVYRQCTCFPSEFFSRQKGEFYAASMGGPGSSGLMMSSDLSYDLSFSPYAGSTGGFKLANIGSGGSVPVSLAIGSPLSNPQSPHGLKDRSSPASKSTLSRMSGMLQRWTSITKSSQSEHRTRKATWSASTTPALVGDHPHSAGPPGFAGYTPSMGAKSSKDGSVSSMRSPLPLFNDARQTPVQAPMSTLSLPRGVTSDIDSDSGMQSAYSDESDGDSDMPMGFILKSTILPGRAGFVHVSHMASSEGGSVSVSPAGSSINRGSAPASPAVSSPSPLYISAVPLLPDDIQSLSHGFMSPPRGRKVSTVMEEEHSMDESIHHSVGIIDGHIHDMSESTESSEMEMPTFRSIDVLVGTVSSSVGGAAAKNASAGAVASSDTHGGRPSTAKAAASSSSSSSSETVTIAHDSEGNAVTVTSAPMIGAINDASGLPRTSMSTARLSFKHSADLYPKTPPSRLTHKLDYKRSSWQSTTMTMSTPSPKNLTPGLSSKFSHSTSSGSNKPGSPTRISSCRSATGSLPRFANSNDPSSMVFQPGLSLNHTPQSSLGRVPISEAGSSRAGSSGGSRRGSAESRTPSVPSRRTDLALERGLSAHNVRDESPSSSPEKRRSAAGECCCIL